jgi:glyoxylase-like metal-dependent hydrolase (beta-lactamase superfamily II)
MKEALLKLAPSAPVKAIIYTHSHIDHIGGASAWEENGTQIWATDAFIPHFLKQYGMFRPAETRRGVRQFGFRASLEALPCSALGRRIDYEGAMSGGIRLPNNTFSGIKVLEIGGLKIEMRESHGETHDQLIVWVPQEDTLIAADNFYWTFPNLYTIRGTSPQ